MKKFPLFSVLFLIAAMFVATPTFAQSKKYKHIHKSHQVHKKSKHKHKHKHKNHPHSHSHTVIVTPQSQTTNTVIVKPSTHSKPRIGTVAYTIPSGYTVVEFRGAKHYYVNGIYYRPEIRNGKPVYIIVHH